MGDRINFSLGNKTYYLLLGIFAVLIVSGVAYAYQSEQSPSVFGHSLEETQNFFISTQDNSGCFTDYTTEVDCNAEDTCFWNGESCSPLNPSSVTKIKLKAGVALTSDGTKAYATEGYVDSAVASVSVGGDGVPSVSVGAKCPRFITSDTIRKGRTWAGQEAVWYDGFITTKGLNVQEATSGEEYVYYKSCVENSDGTVTFERPFLKDGAAIAEMYPEFSISLDDFLAHGVADVNYPSGARLFGGSAFYQNHIVWGDWDTAIDNSAVLSVLSKFCGDFGLVPNDLEATYTYEGSYTTSFFSRNSIFRTEPIMADGSGSYIYGYTQYNDGSVKYHERPIMDTIICK